MNALRSLRFSNPRLVSPSTSSTLIRTAATAPSITAKRAGDISDAFVSLSGGGAVPLDPRFAELKKQLIAGHEEAVVESWLRLLAHLKEEIATLKQLRSRAVPSISFADVKAGNVSDAFKAEYLKRGVAVIRNVVDTNTALGWKSQIRDYVAKNPHTKAFPANNPQVFELYWSAAQLRARSHPNLQDTERFLMSFWTASPESPISLRHPVTYADRLRIRQPGDAQFALGPHMDAGSVERWETDGYGLGGRRKGVYTKVFHGNWEDWDPWDAEARLGSITDLYQGIGACSVFRASQGWMAMSNVKGGEGHLMVNPMLRGATAYVLLRPFFEAVRSVDKQGSEEEYLDPSNWRLEAEPSSLIQGASPGHGQELNALIHPHLDLPTTMVHMPEVHPGDYVAWHCDTIHAVDSVHRGSSDSSVLYIPVCPLTEDNARYLVRQREKFLNGTPSPDFGGGDGEMYHAGRPTAADLPALMDADGIRAMGLMEWDTAEPGLTKGEKEVLERANMELGF
jgi:Protein of unknown function (DUF1479)